MRNCQTLHSLNCPSCDKDQQDVHFFLIIYFHYITSTCLEEIIFHHQEVRLYIVHLGNVHRPTAMEYIFPLFLL